MPIPAPKERLQPTLLHRFDSPKLEQPKPFTEKELLASVRENLLHLFEAVNITSVTDLAAFPEIRRSVLNYGIASLAGRVLHNNDIEPLKEMLREAIRHFEPRILPESIEIDQPYAEASSASFSLTIRGQVHAVPIPLEFYLLSEWSQETGQITYIPRPKSATSADD